MEKSIRKIDLWSVCVYLILYSIAGFFIETLFGIFTKGVIESRKSFLYGPFCCIYGIGAIAMILFLRNEKSTRKLFLGGAMIGAIVEYLMSFICEKFLGVKWWDYSDFFLNINGRTCLFFAISWGILAIVLMKYINPNVDYWIENWRQKNYFFKTITTSLIVFFMIDAMLTIFVLKIFYYRISAENNLNIKNSVEVKNKYAQIQENHNLASFIDGYYDNEKMLKNYPNLMIAEENEKDVYIENLLAGVKSYYYRLGDALK